MEHLYRAKDQEAIDLAKTFERRRCNHGMFAKKKEHKLDDDDDKKDNEKDKDTKEDEEVDEWAESEDEDAAKAPAKSKSGKSAAKDDKFKPLSAFECMRDVIIVGGKNKHRYVVATQKPKLRGLLRMVPGVPLIYMNRSVMIMEPMSPATERARQVMEESKLSSGLNDRNAARKHAIEEEEEAAPVAKKRRGPKEPNPLSVKKKKTTTTTPSQPHASESEKPEADGKKKRRRRHKPKNEREGGSDDHEGDNEGAHESASGPDVDSDLE